MFSPHEFKKRCMVSRIPKIFVTPNALSKMWHLVDLCPDEIGWLGTVKVTKDGDFLVDEIFLPEQDVHSTTTEITPEGHANLVMKILDDNPETGSETVNSIRLWGHSHVNMDTNPSGQDESQVKEFAADNDWFIRVIANKKHKMQFTIFLFSQGITVEDAEWTVVTEVDDSLRDSIKKEIEDKVKKLSYGTTSGGYHRGTSYYPSNRTIPGRQGHHQRVEEPDLPMYNLIMVKRKNAQKGGKKNATSSATAGKGK